MSLKVLAIEIVMNVKIAAYWNYKKLFFINCDRFMARKVLFEKKRKKIVQSSNFCPKEALMPACLSN